MTYNNYPVLVLVGVSYAANAKLCWFEHLMFVYSGVCLLGHYDSCVSTAKFEGVMDSFGYW